MAPQEPKPAARAGRPPRLTTDQVVAEAIAIVDRDGLDSLSMPRLARRLGVGTMTLYTYVEGKDDLLDRMAATIFLDLEVPAGSGLDRLGDYFRSFRRTALQHPALARLLARGRITIPAVFDHLEDLLGSLGDVLEPGDAVRAFYAALAYTIGFVIWEIPRSHLQPPESYPAQWTELLGALDAGRYPFLTGPAASHVGRVASETQFEWGLRSLLDGMPGAGPTGRR